MARMSSDNVFRAEGPTYEKELSLNLVCKGGSVNRRLAVTECTVLIRYFRQCCKKLNAWCSKV